MDAIRKAAAAAKDGIGGLDRGIQARAREAAEKALAESEARRRAAALMAPSATTAAAASPHAAPGLPSPGWSAAAPDVTSPGGLFGTPARRGGPPGGGPSLRDAAGGEATPGAKAAVEDLYGSLDELRRATLATPATPPHYGHGGTPAAASQPPLDVSALADMLRIDICTRRALAPRRGAPCARMGGKSKD